MIAHAVQTCYNCHFPDEPLMDLGRIKTEATEINVWASSCMVAIEGNDPVAVVVGAKREGETLIRRIGVHPDRRGDDLGSHLLRSLSAKLAIVGPPKLIAEVPDDLKVVGFFERLGFGRETDLVDYVSPEQMEPVPETGAVQPVPVRDLLTQTGLWRQKPEAWDRAESTLKNRKDKLTSYALLSPEQIEAAVILRQDPDTNKREIVRFGCKNSQTVSTFLPLLIRHGFQNHGRLHIPKLHPKELPPRILTDLGFTETRRHGKYTAIAQGD
ncbi:MAG: GNAT family N-acetyltransferase [Acidobacteriota bacterium]|nr:GNAT family N-acetyltransferase [Acidobacteriota bacterium]